MAIDMASVYAARYRKQPDMLRAAVMGQSPDPKLDSYTALNALRLVKEADMMDMAGKAQQPTSSPSLVAQNMAPNPMMQGLGAMVPGAMGQAPQGMPQRAVQAPPMQAASGGLTSLPTADEDYAEGGIVAFARGGRSLGSDVSAENDYQQETDDEGYSDSQGRSIDADGNLIDDGTDAGTGSATDRFNSLLAKQIAKIQGGKSRVTSPDDAAKMEEEYYQRELRRAGPDIYKDEIARGPQDEADRLKARRVGEANALFTAAGKVLTGNRLSSGAREALPAYGNEMSKVEQADQAAKSANARAQFALKDAQRKERMGSSRAAQASMENYRKFQQDENKAELDRDRAVAELAAKGVIGNRATGKGAGVTPAKLAERLADAEEAFALNPTAENKARLGALSSAASKMKTSFSTGEIGALKAETALEPVRSRENIEANKALDRHKLMNRRDWKKAVEEAGSEQAATAKFKNDWVKNNSQAAEAAPAKSTAPAAAAKPTATSKVVSMADVNATVASSGRTKQEVIDALNAKGYTVK
jgi:hypothetical protein